MRTPVTPRSAELGGETEAAGGGCAISGCINHRATASGAGEGWRNGVPAGAGVAVIRDPGQRVSLALSPRRPEAGGRRGVGEGREGEGGVGGGFPVSWGSREGKGSDGAETPLSAPRDPEDHRSQGPLGKGRGGRPRRGGT